MKSSEAGQLLRIFIDESEKYHGHLLFETIVLKARELKIAGASVFKGIMGYGADSKIHSSKILRLSDSMPVVIEMVDTEEKISQILPFLEETVKEGLITIENLQVIRYRHD